MSVPQYQAQLQEQHQEVGEPAAAPAAGDAPHVDGAGDDDIINDILGDKAKGEKDERRPREPDPDEPDPDEPGEAAPEPEEDEPEEDDLDIAAEDDGEEPTGSLAAARAALEDGDLDKAFLLAFGKKPEELLPNAYTWTKWRAANDRAARKIAEQQRGVEAEQAQNRQWVQSERQKIHNTIEALRPYEEIHNARVAFKRDGDPSLLVKMIELTSELTYDEAQKIILTKTRRTPGERAMAARLQELEQRLHATTAEREQQTQRQTQEQTYASDLAHIRQNVSGEVSKIPRFAERIYNVLVKTRSAVGLTKTVEQAAQMVIAAERKRIANHPFVKKPGKKVPPVVSNAARTLARRGKPPGAPLRRNSQNNGAPNGAEETTDDIVADILKARTRRLG